ncbi:MAG: hypothetical protein Kow00109_28520 [Acidobacteriota bacterium]
MRVPAGSARLNPLEGPFLHAPGTWRLLRVSGPDAREFLHNILSNEVRGLAPGRGNRQLLLTATGKIAADFWCQCLDETEFLLVASGWTAEPRELLEAYVIMDDVEVNELAPGWHVEAVEGEGAAEVVRRRLGVTPPGEFGAAVPFGCSGCSGWVVCRPELAAEGFLVVVGPAAGDSPADCRDRLGLGDLPRLSAEQETRLRLARGVPRFGVDYSGSNNPVEAGLREAYSLTKGCFPGQEVVSKATRVGGVRRRLSRLKLEGAAPPSGAKIFLPGGAEVGWVTSAAGAPEGAGAFAFGYVLSKVAVPGAGLAVGKPDGPRAWLLEYPRPGHGS